MGLFPRAGVPVHLREYAAAAEAALGFCAEAPSPAAAPPAAAASLDSLQRLSQPPPAPATTAAASLDSLQRLPPPPPARRAVLAADDALAAELVGGEAAARLERAPVPTPAAEHAAARPPSEEDQSYRRRFVDDLGTVRGLLSQVEALCRDGARGAGDPIPPPPPAAADGPVPPPVPAAADGPVAPAAPPPPSQSPGAQAAALAPDV